MDWKDRNHQGRNLWQSVQDVWLYTDLLQTLKGETLSSVFSTDGTLISASEAPLGKEKVTTTNHEENKQTNKNPTHVMALQTQKLGPLP